MVMFKIEKRKRGEVLLERVVEDNVCLGIFYGFYERLSNLVLEYLELYGSFIFEFELSVCEGIVFVFF